MVKPNIQWIDQEFGGTGQCFCHKIMLTFKLNLKRMWQNGALLQCSPDFKSIQSAASRVISQVIWCVNRFGVVTQVMFSMCIFVSYGLQFYVPMEIIGNSLEKTYPARKLGPKLFDYLLRSFFVLITCKFWYRIGLRRYWIWDY